jgi:hypothetical protein
VSASPHRSYPDGAFDTLDSASHFVMAAGEPLVDAIRAAVDRAPHLDQFVALYAGAAGARANGLHTALVRETGWDNPHAVFALLRTFVDLVVVTMEVRRNPSYAEVVAHDPAKPGPGRRRKSSHALVDAAAREVPDMAGAWDLLSEAGGHFGWAAFEMTVTRRTLPDGRFTLTVSTGPGWKDEQLKLSSLRHATDLTVSMAQLIRDITSTPDV